MLPPAGAPILVASDGRRGLGGGGNRRLFAVWCRLGPSRARIWCPGDGGESAASSSLRNKSPRSRPRLGGAYSGAGEGSVGEEVAASEGVTMPVFLPDLVVSFVGVLRRRSIQVLCGGRWVYAEGCLLGLRLQGGWVVLLLLPFCRRRGRFHGWRNSGCVPGRFASPVLFFCGSFQSSQAMGFLLPPVLRSFSSDVAQGHCGGRRRQWRRTAVFASARVPRGLVVIFCLLRDFCANVCGQLSLLYVSSMYLYGVGVVLVRLV